VVTNKFFVLLFLGVVYLIFPCLVELQGFLPLTNSAIQLQIKRMLVLPVKSQCGVAFNHKHWGKFLSSIG